MIKGHGGNIFELAMQLGCEPSEIIDMSSNMNPLGPPADLMNHLHDNLEAIRLLPEVDAAGAVAAFADRWALEYDQVLAGNGTTQFIYAIPLALESEKTLIIGPTYADYADACRMHRVPFEIAVSRKEHAFQPDFREIEHQIGGVDTVFICNPNNPTGVLVPSEELITFIRAHPRVRFVVDESYLPFVTGAESESLIPKRLPNVIILYSMSKIYRIPGLRIGFLVAPKKWMDRIHRYCLPWCVNSLSQEAVRYLMRETKGIEPFVTESREYLAMARQRVFDAFQGAPQIRLYPSVTSFVLAELYGQHSAESVSEFLSKRKILIRNCANFSGLSHRFIRISLKTRDVNDELIRWLRELIGG